MASNQGGNKGGSKGGSQQSGGNQGGNQGGQGKSGSQQSGTSNRGFASMDPQRQREIASEGGKAAHQKGTAHEFTSEEARRAGSMSHGGGSKQSDSGGSKGGTGGGKPGGK